MGAALDLLLEVYRDPKKAAVAAIALSTVLILMAVGWLPSAWTGIAGRVDAIGSATRALGAETQHMRDHLAVQTEILGVQCGAIAKLARDDEARADCKRMVEKSRDIDRHINPPDQDR